MNNRVIALPVIVIYKSGAVVRILPEEFINRRRATSNGNLLFPDGGNGYFDVRAILDRRGLYYEAIEVTKRSRQMRWFSAIWDFVKTEYQVFPPKVLTVGELLELAKDWSNVGGRTMRKFLNQQNSDTLFDEAMFRKLWEHTYVKLPEADWHREFELR